MNARAILIPLASASCTLGLSALSPAVVHAPAPNVQDEVTSSAPTRNASLLQVRAKAMLLADGSRIENAALVIEDGKITRVGRGVELDTSLPTIEHDGVLTAGLVALNASCGADGELFDVTRSLLPEAHAAHAFDPDHSDFRDAAEQGITTVVLTPSNRNVAGGLTAVVKTSGGTVLRDGAHLALSFAKDSLGTISGGFFSFADAGRATDLVSSEEGGPETTDTSGRGTRAPTSYAGAARELRERVRAGEGAFGRVRDGSLPVLFDAWDRNEVARALGLARELSLKGALRGAPLAGELAQEIQAAGLGVVLGPFQLGQTRASLASVGALADAGVPLAFALDAPGRDPRGLRLSAALALSAGADRAVLWKALTSDAARLAGVADRVGALERGRDADFVLWSGDPLDLRSRVEAVFVDGSEVYRAQASATQEDDDR